jgi:hypothetical protein
MVRRTLEKHVLLELVQHFSEPETTYNTKFAPAQKFGEERQRICSYLLVTSRHSNSNTSVLE